MSTRESPSPDLVPSTRRTWTCTGCGKVEDTDPRDPSSTWQDDPEVPGVQCSFGCAYIAAKRNPGGSTSWPKTTGGTA